MQMSSNLGAGEGESRSRSRSPAVDASLVCTIHVALKQQQQYQQQQQQAEKPTQERRSTGGKWRKLIAKKLRPAQAEEGRGGRSATHSSRVNGKGADVASFSRTLLPLSHTFLPAALLVFFLSFLRSRVFGTHVASAYRLR